MKTKSFQLKVETPCDEDWGQMLSDDDGRFCLLCNKSVIDFTQKSPFEIKSFFLHDNGHTCGRFRQEQLEEIYTTNEFNSLHHYKLVVSLALGLLTLESLNAYSLDGRDFIYPKDSIVSEEIIAAQRDKTVGKIARVISDSIVLKGKILNSISKQPIQGVSIFDEQNNSTVSDSSGMFELKVLNDLPIQLTFKSFGYSEINKIISSGNEQINIMMEVIMMGAFEISEEDLIKLNIPQIPKQNIQPESKSKKRKPKKYK